MPRVERKSGGEVLGAAFGMKKSFAEVAFGHRFKHRYPALVQGIRKGERDLDRHAGVGQDGPGGFIVRLDRGLVFGKSELATDVRVEMTVCDMMHDLADGPAVFAIRSIELEVVESADGGTELRGKLTKCLEVGNAVGGRVRRGYFEAPDGIAEVVHSKLLAFRPQLIAILSAAGVGKPGKMNFLAWRWRSRSRAFEPKLERSGPCQLAGEGPYSVLCSFVLVVMVVMMVLGRGKGRRSNHHNEQGGKQKFLHGCMVALVGLRRNTTLGEEMINAHQERNGVHWGSGYEAFHRNEIHHWPAIHAGEGWRCAGDNRALVSEHPTF